MALDELKVVLTLSRMRRTQRGMTTEPNRVDAGVPTGGQFATKIKSDDVPSLGVRTRRPELEGWPESLPEPEVSFHFGDENVITTCININGEPVFEVWNPGDDVHSVDTTHFNHPELVDSDYFDAAETWAKDKHEQIASSLRAEMHAAVERSRARILAQATGDIKPATDEELAATIENNGAAARQALRDVELASTSLAARKILSTHPTAAFAEIKTDSWENGEFVSGAVVKDSNYDSLHEYFEDFDNEEAHKANAEVVGLLKNLDSEAQNAYWSGAFSTGSYGEDVYTIDLHKAAAWTPGGAA